MSFPEQFHWGAATAAYQIEGATTADGRGPSIWDTFSHTPGMTYRGDTGDIACDHYHRLDEDLDLLSDLGATAYRFSVAWPRIQPDGSGAVNQKGLDFYRRLVEGLLERGIEPFPTLYHWDLPQELEDRGGWTSRETSERFADYAAALYAKLGDRVGHWITLNEPWVAAWNGYGYGVHAPGRRDTAGALAATHHLLLGHGLALARLKSLRPEPRVGITLNFSPARPASESDADAAAARRYDAQLNRLFLDPVFGHGYPADVVDLYGPVSDFAFVHDGDLDTIGRTPDFLGVNFYRPDMVAEATPSHVAGDEFLAARKVVPEHAQTTAMGWPVEPEALTELLVRIARDYTAVPLYITENGAAFHDYINPEGAVNDVERIEYLRTHIEAAEEAIQRGVDLRGYFAWSLLDNFEWAEGYSKRFGLVFVDYGTQRRVKKDSFFWLRDLIAKGGEVPE